MKFALIGQLAMARALHSRSFALLWLGQTISRLGDGAFMTAVAWAVLLLTGSGTAMGLVLIAFGIPNIIFLLLGGVAADRLPRRLLLIWSDGGRAVAVLLIAILSWLHLLQLWHLVVLSLCFGFVDGFFMPAYQAIVPQLVEPESLASANSLNSLGGSMSRLLGPAIGAAVVALSGPANAFAFDALTFVISVVCLLAIRPSTLTNAERAVESMAEKELIPVVSLRGMRKVMADIREGLGYLLSSPWLWVTTTVASLANIGFAGPLSVALPKLIHDVYGTGVWLLGALSTASAIGAILATVIVGQIKHLRRRGIVAYGALILSSLAIILFGVPLPRGIEPVVACFADGLFGFGIEVFMIIWMTLIQQLVPVDKLGRVFSIDTLGSTCIMPIGFAITGVLTDHIGPALVFIGGGTLNVVLMCAALCVKGVREVA